jgi:transcriptional regulator with XRE-family HTH domain
MGMVQELSAVESERVRETVLAIIERAGSQNRAAMMLGVSQSQLSHFVSSRRGASFRLVTKVAALLNVDAGVVLLGQAVEEAKALPRSASPAHGGLPAPMRSGDRRERIATALLAGMCGPANAYADTTIRRPLAVAAVDLADTLIAVLEGKVA